MKTPKKDDPRAKILKAIKQLSLKNARARKGVDAAREVAHAAKAALKKARKAFKKAKKLAREARKELKALRRTPAKPVAGKKAGAKSAPAGASKKTSLPRKARSPVALDPAPASVKASPFPAMAAPEPTEVSTIPPMPPPQGGSAEDRPAS